MSRLSELDLCVGELKAAARSLNAVADSLSALFSSGKTEPYVFTQLSSDNVQVGSVEAASPKPKPITLEQVRAVLAEKSRGGHTAEVRLLLEKHGAAKLSEIDPAEYAALLAEAEVLGDG